MRLTYKDCARRGHDWGRTPLRLFPWGWRWPWISHALFTPCRGCGIGRYDGKGRTKVWPRFRE